MEPDGREKPGTCAAPWGSVQEWHRKIKYHHINQIVSNAGIIQPVSTPHSHKGNHYIWRFNDRTLPHKTTFSYPLDHKI